MKKSQYNIILLCCIVIQSTGIESTKRQKISRTPRPRPLEYMSLHGVAFHDLEPPNDTVWGEHFYGECATSRKTLFHQVTLSKNFLTRRRLEKHADCVYVRFTTPVPEFIKMTPIYYSVCLHELIYIYHHEIFRERYYEFFKPEQTISVDFEILFYERKRPRRL